MADQNDDFIVYRARQELCEGVIYEPRGFFDFGQINPASTTLVSGTPGAFYNGEQFPVRLTHLLMSFALDPAADDRQLQNIGLRLRYHDHYYMNRVPAPLPLWENQVVATPDYISPGSSVWHFARPFILSKRDTLFIQVQQLDGTQQNQRSVSVGLHGVGFLSKRPYFLSVESDLINDGLFHTLNSAELRNDGSEPIIVDSIVVQASAVTDAADPLGDTRAFTIQVRQVGNGTGTDWFEVPVPQTPTLAVPLLGMPVPLLGPHGGRAIVHRIPGDGMVLTSGDGFDIDWQNLGIAGGTTLTVVLGAIGYIAVQ
jgi:hypothetical protein